ncbi:MAG: HAMP domain-containing histidine kinase [Planctomycetes bacterium]|nr:HAMP domain-containing histidine kinase [Planctomycetota bacterium]
MPRVGRLSPAPGIVVREHPDRAVTMNFLRDLGLPLATVKTLLEMVDVDTLPEAARTAIAAAAENAAYARDLLRDFANYQALEAGHSRVTSQRVGLRRWLGEALDAARQRPAARELGLVVTHASLLPDAAQFDARLASAAVDAVLRVACERAERGPVHVRVAYLPSATDPAGARLHLRVTTRGGGFGEIDCSYAFVPFVAQDQQQRPLFGLTLARRW